MYKLLKSPFDAEPKCVVRLSDGTSIPFADGNTDYQAFLRWCEEGNTPTPADEPTAE